MTEYQEGDLIRATQGDVVIQGRLTKEDWRSDLSIKEAGWGIDSLTSGIHGEWEIEVIERAKSYTKDEVLKVVRKAAWDLDPDYVYHMGTSAKIIKRLEESL